MLSCDEHIYEMTHQLKAISRVSFLHHDFRKHNHMPNKNYTGSDPNVYSFEWCIPCYKIATACVYKHKDYIDNEDIIHKGTT